MLGGMPQWQDACRARSPAIAAAWRARSPSGGHLMVLHEKLESGALAHGILHSLSLVLALFVISSTAMAERLSNLPAASACRTLVLRPGLSRPSAAARSRG